jgi:hypothetical protein
MGVTMVMGRRKGLLLVISGVIVLSVIGAASWFFLRASRSTAEEGSALSDASMSSERASAGARRVGSSNPGEQQH